MAANENITTSFGAELAGEIESKAAVITTTERLALLREHGCAGAAYVLGLTSRTGIYPDAHYASIEAAAADYDRHQRAADALDRANAHGRNWDWEAAGKALRTAYRAFGEAAPHGTPLEAGYAWHRGQHDLQSASRRLGSIIARVHAALSEARS